MAISLKLARMQSNTALNICVALTLHVRAGRQGPVAATGADQVRDRIATRQHQRARMIECVWWQSGSRLPSMVVVCLHNCTSAPACRPGDALAKRC
jgi:hypothetical protein